MKSGAWQRYDCVAIPHVRIEVHCAPHNATFCSAVLLLCRLYLSGDVYVHAILALFEDVNVPPLPLTSASDEVDTENGTTIPEWHKPGTPSPDKEHAVPAKSGAEGASTNDDDLHETSADNAGKPAAATQSRDENSIRGATADVDGEVAKTEEEAAPLLGKSEAGPQEASQDQVQSDANIVSTKTQKKSEPRADSAQPEQLEGWQQKTIDSDAIRPGYFEVSASCLVSGS